LNHSYPQRKPPAWALVCGYPRASSRSTVAASRCGARHIPYDTERYSPCSFRLAVSARRAIRSRLLRQPRENFPPGFAVPEQVKFISPRQSHECFCLQPRIVFWASLDSVAPSSRRDASRIAQDKPGAVLGKRNQQMKLPRRGSARWFRCTKLFSCGRPVHFAGNHTSGVEFAVRWVRLRNQSPHDSQSKAA
jgi:hypothetical protein